MAAEPCWNHAICEQMVEPGSDGSATWTEGWVEVRPQGGHGVLIVDRVTHPRWLCPFCVRNAKSGNAPGQLSLIP
jgi:hypothetical protein